MPISSRELFARLIKCEAGGEGIDGMKAVATVVMNRVHVAYGEYLRCETFAELLNNLISLHACLPGVW